LNEQRDLNEAAPLFERARSVKLDPEMITLATQLVERQSEPYDPSDLEDRYETRLRAMLDSKIKGEGLRTEAEPAAAESNVIDLIAALRKSLGEAPAAAKPKGSKETAAKRGQKPEPPRSQPALKLPLPGGKQRPAAAAEPQARPSRRKAS
ncbi:MAG: hypothetical protein JOZ05_13905, partial [Acetobacteraceae bacterium]|nr:hypothetical protein [Acetobacteraceae bacterium]